MKSIKVVRKVRLVRKLGFKTLVREFTGRNTSAVASVGSLISHISGEMAFGLSSGALSEL